MADGILIVFKEKEYTSFDVVAVLRKIFGQKKIGHGGTLDPMAEGVLPVFLGNATKLCDIQENTDKTYEAEILLGQRTDTDDIWGAVLETRPVLLSEDEVVRAVMSFQGEILQVPPMYSAKKLNGKKLYELAREGVTVERKSVPVTIRRIEVTWIRLPYLKLRVTCSKGTYIRSLARDIGEKLGTFGVMSGLLRTGHGRFTVNDAYRLSEIREAAENGRLAELVIPPDRMFSAYPSFRTREDTDRFLMNGNRILPEYTETEGEPENGALYRAYFSDGYFAALYRYRQKEGCFTVEKMFPRGDH